MSLSEKKVGMLLGLHAGDSLGATLEFLPPSLQWNTHQEIIGGGHFHWTAGDATDDTDLMMCLLRSLEGPEKISFDILREQMLRWYESNPPDIGTTTIQGLRNMKNGLPLESCGVSDERFQGNGSLMRVAPLSLLSDEASGFYAGKVISGLSSILQLQTKMTHGHSNCLACDVIFINSLRAILAGDSKQKVFEIAVKTAESLSPTIAEQIRKVSSFSWEQVSTSGFCIDTLSASFWAFLKYDTFKDAVVAIVNRGDDSDTCGAVTGALCGAFYGVKEIPDHWLGILEHRLEIEKILRLKEFIS